MAAVMEKHLGARRFLVGDSVTGADFVVAYTLDWANDVKLLDDTPYLKAYMERMYSRPKAPPRITAAFASLRS
jgi:glutathione S-transferase